jgi:hypothetical protein
MINTDNFSVIAEGDKFILNNTSSNKYLISLIMYDKHNRYYCHKIKSCPVGETLFIFSKPVPEIYDIVILIGIKKINVELKIYSIHPNEKYVICSELFDILECHYFVSQKTMNIFTYNSDYYFEVIDKSITVDDVTTIFYDSQSIDIKDIKLYCTIEEYEANPEFKSVFVPLYNDRYTIDITRLNVTPTYFFYPNIPFTTQLKFSRINTKKAVFIDLNSINQSHEYEIPIKYFDNLVPKMEFGIISGTFIVERQKNFFFPKLITYDSSGQEGGYQICDSDDSDTE